MKISNILGSHKHFFLLNVVIDNGTGYTKMGFAGNCEPSYLVPTTLCMAGDASKAVAGKEGLQDMDFYIGEEVRT